MTTLPRALDHFRIDSSGCWIWTARIDPAGYGRVTWQGRSSRLAHRTIYEFRIGPIPAGLELDHLCRVTACVNPEHLEPVTGPENRRRQGAARTHCRRGHEFTESSTYRHPRTGRRYCHLCKMTLQRERRQAARV